MWLRLPSPIPDPHPAHGRLLGLYDEIQPSELKFIAVIGKMMKNNKTLTMPEFCVDTVLIEQFSVRTGLSNMSILEHQDLVTVVDRPQSVRDEHARTGLLFQDFVDVLHKRLLRVCVKRGCLEEYVSEIPLARAFKPSK
jgi:hypothetical protein